MGARYTGIKVGVVRIGDRPIMPGESIAGPPALVATLLRRSDFEDDAQAKPKKKQTLLLRLAYQVL